MAFSVKFISNDWYSKDERLAEVTIGNFHERIAIPIGYWSEADYIRQWREAIERITEDDPRQSSALVVSMYAPETINFIKWWVLYRNDDTVYVQNSLLFTDDLKDSFDPKLIYTYIHRRETAAEDGSKISEWQTSVSELKTFLEQLKVS